MRLYTIKFILFTKYLERYFQFRSKSEQRSGQALPDLESVAVRCGVGAEPVRCGLGALSKIDDVNVSTTRRSRRVSIFKWQTKDRSRPGCGMSGSRWCGRHESWRWAGRRAGRAGRRGGSAVCGELPHDGPRVGEGPLRAGGGGHTPPAGSSGGRQGAGRGVVAGGVRATSRPARAQTHGPSETPVYSGALRDAESRLATLPGDGGGRRRGLVCTSGSRAAPPGPARDSRPHAGRAARVGRETHARLRRRTQVYIER